MGCLCANALALIIQTLPNAIGGTPLPTNFITPWRALLFAVRNYRGRLPLTSRPKLLQPFNTWDKLLANLLPAPVTTFSFLVLILGEHCDFLAGLHINGIVLRVIFLTKEEEQRVIFICAWVNILVSPLLAITLTPGTRLYLTCILLFTSNLGRLCIRNCWVGNLMVIAFTRWTTLRRHSPLSRKKGFRKKKAIYLPPALPCGLIRHTQFAGIKLGSGPRPLYKAWKFLFYTRQHWQGISSKVARTNDGYFRRTYKAGTLQLCFTAVSNNRRQR